MRRTYKVYTPSHFCNVCTCFNVIRDGREKCCVSVYVFINLHVVNSGVTYRRRAQTQQMYNNKEKN